MASVTVVYAEDTGDWVALYRDGVRVAEGHSLSEGELMRALGVEFEIVRASAEDNGWRFPDRLEDLVRP